MPPPTAATVAIAAIGQPPCRHRPAAVAATTAAPAAGAPRCHSSHQSLLPSASHLLSLSSSRCRHRRHELCVIATDAVAASLPRTRSALGEGGEGIRLRRDRIPANTSPSPSPHSAKGTAWPWPLSTSRRCTLSPSSRLRRSHCHLHSRVLLSHRPPPSDRPLHVRAASSTSAPPPPAQETAPCQTRLRGNAAATPPYPSTSLSSPARGAGLPHRGGRIRTVGCRIWRGGRQTGVAALSSPPGPPSHRTRHLRRRRLGRHAMLSQELTGVVGSDPTTSGEKEAPPPPSLRLPCGFRWPARAAVRQRREVAGGGGAPAAVTTRVALVSRSSVTQALSVPIYTCTN